MPIDYSKTMGYSRTCSVRVCEHINGSGPKYGHDKWPAVQVRVDFPKEGGEKAREQFLIALDEFFRLQGFPAPRYES
jgi:hypothetical protein